MLEEDNSPGSARLAAGYMEQAVRPTRRRDVLIRSVHAGSVKMDIMPLLVSSVKHEVACLRVLCSIW